VAEDLICHIRGEYALAFRKAAVVDPAAVLFSDKCFAHGDPAVGDQQIHQAAVFFLAAADPREEFRCKLRHDRFVMREKLLLEYSAGCAVLIF